MLGMNQVPWLSIVLGWCFDGLAVLTLAGLVATLIESLAVGLGLRAPGFVRNLLTTSVGAAIAFEFPANRFVP
jgi:uncharacterized membrane protein